jgi:hypothetical protein
MVDAGPVQDRRLIARMGEPGTHVLRGESAHCGRGCFRPEPVS